MNITPFQRWIAEHQRQGNLPDTQLVNLHDGTVVQDGKIIDGDTVMGDGQSWNEARYIYGQILFSALTHPEFIEQIRHMEWHSQDKWHDSEFRANMRRHLSSTCLSTEQIDQIFSLLDEPAKE